MSQPKRRKRKRHLPIGTILLVMNLAILVLPLSGIWGLRLYESALIRQTESELIAQAAIIASAYRQAWRAAGGTADGPAVETRWTTVPGYDPPWLPRPPVLDLATDSLLPPPPALTLAPSNPSDPAAARAGRELDTILREAQYTTLAAMRVLDREGVIVTSTSNDEGIGQSMQEREEVRRALVGEPVSVLRARVNGPTQASISGLRRGSTVRVFVAQPVFDNQRVIGVVVMSRTPRTLAETLSGKRQHLIVLAVLVLGAVGVLAGIGVFAIARPLKSVTRQAKRIADSGDGGLPLRLDAAEGAGPMVLEVVELFDALTSMAATLERRAAYVRSFAAHVAHEFKTPLTTIRGSVELLRDHFDTMQPNERDQFLANIDAEAERLNRLVRRLLDLARAEAAGPARHDSCPLATLLTRFQTERCTVVIREDVSVPMGEEAMEVVLTQLLDNVQRHAGPEANVVLTLGQDGEDVVLTVADDGPGVSPANAERIFTPFFTTARKEGGTGLGLSIVQNLIEVHGGRVRLVASLRGGVFEIRFGGQGAFAPCGGVGGSAPDEA